MNVRTAQQRSRHGLPHLALAKQPLQIGQVPDYPAVDLNDHAIDLESRLVGRPAWCY